MATQVLEGTWEEIAAHAGELAGKRLRVFVETSPEEHMAPVIPVVGPVNEGMLAALREIEEIQRGMRHTQGNIVQMIRHGRTSPLYGRESTED